MAKATKNTAVAAPAPTMIMVQDEVPEYLRKEGPARGNENVQMEDLVVPRLEVIQGLSPAVKRGDPGYIEGAQQGMLNNSVTRKLYGDAVFVIPVYFTKQYLVWKARKDKNGKAQEGGFFGAFNDMVSAEVRAEAEGGIDEGIEVIDTPQHLCLLLDTEQGTVEEIMISMPRTKAKISRQWNSMVKLTEADRFARVYRIGTELQSNSQGDFYNFSVKIAGFPPPDLYKRAEALFNSITKGERTVVMDTSDLETSTREGGGDGGDGEM